MSQVSGALGRVYKYNGHEALKMIIYVLPNLISTVVVIDTWNIDDAERGTHIIGFAEELKLLHLFFFQHALVFRTNGNRNGNLPNLIAFVPFFFLDSDSERLLDSFLESVKVRKGKILLEVLLCVFVFILSFDDELVIVVVGLDDPEARCLSDFADVQEVADSEEVVQESTLADVCVADDHKLDVTIQVLRKVARNLTKAPCDFRLLLSLFFAELENRLAFLVFSWASLDCGSP